MTRRRIELLVTFALSLLMVPGVSTAQPPTKIPRIGFLMLGAPAPASPFFEVFRQSLREFGFVEGDAVLFEYRWAQSTKQFPALATDLVRLKVDVIVASTRPGVEAARQATRTIPIVILPIFDPETFGFVGQLSRPGGNITGVTGMVLELPGKQLELLTAAVPQISRVAVLWDPRIPGIATLVDEVKGAAQALGMEVLPLEVDAPGKFPRAFETATQGGAGALLMLPAILIDTHRSRLGALTVKHRLPGIYWHRQFAEAGGLMAYGPSRPELWRRAAVLVGKILQGAKPGDLPVERAMRFELVINRASREG
jgi:putative ABC transport system substrate-binding protein